MITVRRPRNLKRVLFAVRLSYTIITILSIPPAIGVSPEQYAMQQRSPISEPVFVEELQPAANQFSLLE